MLFPLPGRRARQAPARPCQFRLTNHRCQFKLTGMDIEKLSGDVSSDDPAIGLRASLALHRLAERVEAHHVASAREKGWSWQQSGDALRAPPPIRARQIQQGAVMTTEPAAPEVLHGWHVYLQASEEARRRGDRRTGTDHVLLALLEDPSIEVMLGVSLQQARQALESLDLEALGARGLGRCCWAL